MRTGSYFWADGKEASAKLLNLAAPMLRAEASAWTELEFLTQGLGEGRQRDRGTRLATSLASLWSNIKASPENRDEAGEGDYFDSVFRDFL